MVWQADEALSRTESEWLRMQIRLEGWKGTNMCKLQHQEWPRLPKDECLNAAGL